MAYQNFYATKTTSSPIGAADTTITLLTPPTVTSGRLVIEPKSPTNREIISFTGVLGNQITGVTRGLGGTTARAHAASVNVQMNVLAEDLQDLYDAFATFSDPAGDGWLPSITGFSTSSGYNNGNRSFTLDTTADMSSVLSPGMRFKIDRAVAAPTQCADLEASSSQYASKSSPTGITFTDDFTCEAWVKLESYNTAQRMTMVSRFNGTTNGFIFNVEVDGVLRIWAGNRHWKSYQAVPLGRMVHLAGSMDLSGSSAKLYIDGVEVPSFDTGTASALVQGGDLMVGAYTGVLNSFDGKLADVRVWSDIRTATEIRDNMYSYPTDTTNLVAHFKLNGNFNDSTANANHLTPSGGAVATSTDNPWNDTEYAIVTAVDASTVTLQTSSEGGIPLQTLENPYYSTQSVPYGFPRGRNKWQIITISQDNTTAITSTAPSNTQAGSVRLQVPIGAWDISFKMLIDVSRASATAMSSSVDISPTNSTTDFYLDASSYASKGSPTGTQRIGHPHRGNTSREYAAATTLYLMASAVATSGGLSNSSGLHYLKAECAYL